MAIAIDEPDKLGHDDRIPASEVHAAIAINSTTTSKCARTAGQYSI